MSKYMKNKRQQAVFAMQLQSQNRIEKHSNNSQREETFKYGICHAHLITKYSNEDLKSISKQLMTKRNIQMQYYNANLIAKYLRKD